MMTGYIVPLDTVSVEIVENTKTGLLDWRALTSCSVVRLGQTSSSCGRPVGTGREWDGRGVRVGPVDNLFRMVDDTTGPEISLSILSYKTVESILLGRRIEGHRFHSHGVAVRLSFMLLEGGTSNIRFPGGNIVPQNIVIGISPVKVWLCSCTQVGSTNNSVGLRRKR